ncbi:MAG: hypothetical protein J4F36_07520 [Nitrosopumilaceae archaeon]|nr:hypothetical protein [Nitrosopumilaceae archaeon]
MSVDFNRITSMPHVQEMREVVGIWEISIEQCPVDFKVKVIRTGVIAAPYSGIANFAIKNPDQADSYYSYSNFQTVQEALEDSIRGFLTYYKIDKLENTKFTPVEGW